MSIDIRPLRLDDPGEQQDGPLDGTPGYRTRYHIVDDPEDASRRYAEGLLELTGDRIG